METTVMTLGNADLIRAPVPVNTALQETGCTVLQLPPTQKLLIDSLLKQDAQMGSMLLPKHPKIFKVSI